ncbi:DUF6460 domain-containing protein [uncultured Roseibium sp.]|uniref:DUF6460 domain-containing protein n=1 Tax=uncultured Roseibium sp. TaxID=1936171 RepID=UPI00259451D5|nr:DUF6460 domain-containing protein [uncultured Roseibium sp.]
MSERNLSRFMGGSPGQVILRLVFLSFVVGVILSALDLDPLEIVDIVVGFFKRLWEMGFDAIVSLLRYFALGAVIVVPLWLISRVLNLGSKG